MCASKTDETDKDKPASRRSFSECSTAARSLARSVPPVYAAGQGSLQCRTASSIHCSPLSACTSTTPANDWNRSARGLCVHNNLELVARARHMQSLCTLSLGFLSKFWYLYASYQANRTKTELKIGLDRFRIGASFRGIKLLAFCAFDWQRRGAASAAGEGSPCKCSYDRPTHRAESLERVKCDSPVEIS